LCGRITNKLEDGTGRILERFAAALDRA